MFVKGAHARSFDLPFGKSHRDRGVRRDSHDAIGIELRVMVEAEPEPSSKRNRTGDAPQPVQPGVDAGQLGDASQLAHAAKAAPPWRARPGDDAGKLGDASQLARPAKAGPRNCLQYNVAEVLEQEIRNFWDNRGDEGVALQQEVKQLRHLLFRRIKHPVAQDVWFPGASQPREEQHVAAVVPTVFVMDQIKKAI